ncbi:MAG: PhoPQ-activated protein PqaA family protein [Flavobacteriaceae bacterium]
MIKRNLLFITLNLFIGFGCKTPNPEKQPRIPFDVLKEYIQDRTDFSYEIKDSLNFEAAKAYRVKMYSGKWLTEEIVDQPQWWHWVDIIIPHKRDTNKGLLFIGGGSKADSIWILDSLNLSKALQSKSVIAHISNVPFQPITFKENDTIARYEDNLIAYGWDQFLRRGAQEKDAEWLARFPMTRAVVRGMDVIEELTADQKQPVEQFVLSGASKRGWTTWTSAAADSRVIGMAPLVIDLLNIIPSFEHHHKVYGSWSPAVADYVHFNIMDWMGSKEFETLLDYVEPYEFKNVFEMPKLIINGTIDEFFVTDSWQFYYDSLPGKKYLQYVPNGNHGLAGSYNSENVFSFYDRLIHDIPIPKMDWNILPDGFELEVDSSDEYEINLWSITNTNTRDFRIWEVGRNWQKTAIKKNKEGIYKIEAPSKDGFTASLVEVVFNTNSNNPLTLTTGTLVLPNEFAFEKYKPTNPKGSYE